MKIYEICLFICCLICVFLLLGYQILDINFPTWLKTSSAILGFTCIMYNLKNI